MRSILTLYYKKIILSIMTTISQCQVGCVGRIVLDIYGNQLGNQIPDMHSYSTYIGGSSANIAVGLSRLGVKTTFISKVGNDNVGNFLRNRLIQEKVNVSQLQNDSKKQTGLCILSIYKPNDQPRDIFAQDSASFNHQTKDINLSKLKKLKIIIINGSHFAKINTRKVCEKIINFAKKNNIKLVMDVDYRPALWGLISASQGNTMYVKSSNVTKILQKYIKYFNYVVGTNDEINILGGSEKVDLSLKKIFHIIKNGVVVHKLGKRGCRIYDINSNKSKFVTVKSFKSTVVNAQGAGDSFLSGFVKGLISNLPFSKCGLIANACGAIIVSRHACSDSSPSMDEINFYLSSKNKQATIKNPKFLHLHWQTRRVVNKMNKIILIESKKSYLKYQQKNQAILINYKLWQYFSNIKKNKIIIDIANQDSFFTISFDEFPSNVSFAINIHEKNYKKLDYYILKKLKTKCEQARSYFSIISNFNNSNNIKVMFNNLNNFNIFPDLLIINNKKTLENKKDIINYVDRLQFPPLKIFFLSSKKIFLSNL